MTNNGWQEVAFQPQDVELMNSWIIGAGVNIPLGDTIPFAYGSLTFLFEPELTGHWGSQDLFELDLPVTARYQFPKRILGLNTFAFGIGPSYATEPPPVEQQRGKGGSENTLIYWKIEIGHDLTTLPGASVFARLHHRSSGFGLMGESGSMNAVVVGFRQAF
ncbi:MAG: hypothetical protein DI533_11990 [Cereibacter sphaeroides]|uniref:Acyloxyacyl hydrolase n=1 Tax=Cereibacter sphaeroides TaxID=1063 RepID=A0A2W5U3C7_CERSP|nr:MAG: hypothetical protein DI533_11990 [Cereibacter sphaeroides]